MTTRLRQIYFGETNLQLCHIVQRGPMGERLLGQRLDFATEVVFPANELS